MFKLVCFFTPLAIGTMTAGAYGFLLTWMMDDGCAFSPQDNIIFLLGYSLGEGLLIGPVGYLMGLFGFKAMIVLLVVFSVFVLLLFLMAARSIEDDKNEYKILYE